MPPELDIIWRNIDYLLWGRLAQGELGGLLLSVVIALASGVLALCVGIALAILAWFSTGPVRRVLFLWADLIRGIPLIFVIFWVYFLVPALFGGNIPGTVSVILALAWFTSAAVMYSTLSGLQALSGGQREAALSTGLSEIQTLVWVLLPQALINLVPSYVSLFASLIKDTSLAFIVNVPELTMVASQVNNRTQLYPTTIFLFTAAMYFVLCGGLSLLVRRLMRRPVTASWD
ncbi:amino acid ABC transporter permease [Magnetospirillum molischianum]|uniref:Amino acid ABC transporter, permease n=1 Tax=Magnetospirillum molischianum DSM 120 TaxID=1150626 RepID=H8FPE8_MAGML|nr:amino acid ABC transporter permease [Magnetospirillum molischianum]CCG40236.1 Amino acid ABC transporter, permease [Magnetospirillum molischianum DSM 120]